MIGVKHVLDDHQAGHRIPGAIRKLQRSVVQITHRSVYVRMIVPGGEPDQIDSTTSIKEFCRAPEQRELSTPHIEDRTGEVLLCEPMESVVDLGRRSAQDTFARDP